MFCRALLNSANEDNMASGVVEEREAIATARWMPTVALHKISGEVLAQERKKNLHIIHLPRSNKCFRNSACVPNHQD